MQAGVHDPPLSQKQSMNFFAHKSAAERYAQHRPYFHPLVIEKIKLHLELNTPVERALDVGCGTGQSATALKEIAKSVIGIDVSDEMLGLATRQAGIEYRNASAEDLSMFDDSTFDLITTSMAIHWFDHKQFLTEAHRVLKTRGWLIPYTNGFHGKMKENESFEQWSREIYPSRYPAPPRDSTPMTAERANEFGFSSFHMERFQNEVQFTADELSAYLTTQSNVIAAVEQGDETIDDVYLWLVSQTKPYFHSIKATFMFGGSIWYLQKGAV